MVMLLAERLASTVAPASAAWELGGIGTQMSSQISACTTRFGHVRRCEQQVGAERRAVWAPMVIVAADHAVAHYEMSRLIEFAVVGQMDLGHHAEQAAAMDRQRAVVECAGVA